MGTRGRQEYHHIQIKDLKIVRDLDGEVSHIEWVKGPTKTRQGGLKRKPRSVCQTIFNTGGPRCTMVAIMKLLTKHPELQVTLVGDSYMMII